MKLIIEDMIKINKEHLEEDYKEILKEFTIFYKEDEEHIFIEEQKIVLNETQLNTFFYYFFLDNIEIKDSNFPKGNLNWQIWYFLIV